MERDAIRDDNVGRCGGDALEGASPRVHHMDLMTLLLEGHPEGIGASALSFNEKHFGLYHVGPRYEVVSTCKRQKQAA
jgi:hypothetical protein